MKYFYFSIFSMSKIKLKINENSETIKKFSVFKEDVTFFTNSYLIFLILSTILSVYLAYTGQIMFDFLKL